MKKSKINTRIRKVRRSAPEVTAEQILEKLNQQASPKITKAISESTGKFQTGRYEA